MWTLSVVSKAQNTFVIYIFKQLEWINSTQNVDNKFLFVFTERAESNISNFQPFIGLAENSKFK